VSAASTTSTVVRSSLVPREHRGVLAAYLLVGAVNLAGAATGSRALELVSKPLLVPLLVGWVLLVRRASAPRLLVAGLGLAWLGDLALMVDGSAAFLSGLAFFLGMQVAYSAGFVRMGAAATLRRRWWFPASALVLWAALNVALGPSLGELRAPLAVYSAALIAMATLACAVSPVVGAGGVLFLVSDLMIGMDAAGIELPARGLLVMATYIAAQLLITTGWLAADDRVAQRSVRSSE
jgi:uncharacterized membrane protein YhhN